MKVMIMALVALLGTNIGLAEEVDPLAPWNAEQATVATGLALKSLGGKLEKKASELDGISLESLRNEMKISLTSGKNSLRAKATATITDKDGEVIVVSVRSFCHVHMHHDEPEVEDEGHEHEEGEEHEHEEGEEEHEHEEEKLPIDCH